MIHFLRFSPTKKWFRNILYWGCFNKTTPPGVILIVKRPLSERVVVFHYCSNVPTQLSGGMATVVKNAPSLLQPTPPLPISLALSSALSLSHLALSFSLSLSGQLSLSLTCLSLSPPTAPLLRSVFLFFFFFEKNDGWVLVSKPAATLVAPATSGVASAPTLRQGVEGHP
jgi:hypothetical protein